MGNFKFRLEKVWQHRRRLVDTHALNAARADQRVGFLARRIVELDADIARHGSGLVSRPGGTLAPVALIAGARWQEHLYALREDLDGQLQKAVKDLEGHRARLNAAWRDLEVLSRLRDRQETAWRHDGDRRESREMDEIGQIRSLRHGTARNAAAPEIVAAPDRTH